jgi:hypothetical protein
MREVMAVDSEIESGLNDYVTRTDAIVAQAGSGRVKGDWSISEVLGHLTDAARVNLGRIHAKAAGAEPAPGWDQEGFVRSFGYASIPVTYLVDAFRAARENWVAAARSLAAGGLDRGYLLERLEKTREHDEEHLEQLRGG